jgi:CRP-like cAMP-binding protein
MIEFINYLNSIHGLSAEVQAALIKILRAKELRRGQVFLREDEVCDKFAFVVKGLMKVYFETGAKEVIVSFARENEIVLSAQSYFKGKGSGYTIRAIEQSVVVYVLKTELDGLVGRFPELNRHLISIYQDLLSEYHTGLLLLQPKKRLGKLVEDTSWMLEDSRITDRLIAGYLGIGFNSLSRYRRERR